MANASNRAIRQMLLETRSPVSVANFRTRLNSDLESRRGRRHTAGGQPKISTDPALRQARARIVDQIRDRAAE